MAHASLPDDLFMVESRDSTNHIPRDLHPRGGVASNGYRTMQTGWLWAGFALGCAVLAGVVFPGWWSSPWQRLALTWRRRHAVQWSWPRQAARAPRPRLPVIGATVRPWWRPASWQTPVAVVLLLAMPAVAVLGWGLRGPWMLDGFDDRVGVGDERITQLLAGEHLVPPPPLPPEVFATAEVEIERPMLALADRRWEQMDPDFVQRLLWVFRIMKEEHGYDMALLEGWRSPERQNQLAAKGAHVTQATAGQSYHQWGLAADCAFLRNGRLVISERDPWAMEGYRRYGEVAERVGLTWGGRWQMLDLGHVEWRKPGVREAMRAVRGR